MRGIKVPLSEAQVVKEYLIAKGLLDKQFSIERTLEHIIFPVNREFGPPWDFDAEFVQRAGKEREPAIGDLRTALAAYLTPAELDSLRTAFDTVGSIAIMDIPVELEGRKQLIGETLLALNKHLKTVLRKVGGHEGEYRTQRMECVAGEDTRETTVVENGVHLKVHVEEAYYSVRMSTERARILAMIAPGERVLCLFSGVGPYPLLFGKSSPAAEIVGIEINPKAHELAIENLAKNRCTNVRLFCDDAHELLPKLASRGERYNRITMPLPQSGNEFLGEVIGVCARGATIHYYAFKPEGQFQQAVEELERALQPTGRKLQEFSITRTGQQAPRIWRICVDATLD